MTSTFTWLDYSEHERRKMLDVIELFNERTTRDELGIGGIRDAFAHLLPGWEIPKIHPRSLAQDCGFITDYFYEIMYELRRRDVLGPIKDRYQVLNTSSAQTGITGRDVRGVE